ncbi:MAG: DUF6677 family protein [Planctomycetota bacterium]|jgi:hypothetical protein
MPQERSNQGGQLNPGAALLAFAWPGLGHVSLGHRRRGLLIMFGVLLLFLGGVLIGGVDSVDRREDKLWFLAQAACGPVAFATDFINQSYVKQLPEETRLRTTSLGRVNEMGTLFSALAGLMNLVVILDALNSAPHAEPPPRRRTDT